MIMWDNVLMLVIVSLACWKCLDIGLWLCKKILTKLDINLYGDDE